MFKEKPNLLLFVGGVILITVGAIWLFDSLNLSIPSYLFSIEALFYLVGLTLLIVTKFKSEKGYFFILWGCLTTANRLYPNGKINDIGIPLMLIGFGIYYVLKYKSQKKKFDSIPE